MINKYALLISALILSTTTSVFANDCKLYFMRKTHVETLHNSNSEVKELSKVANKVLKESYEILYKIDRVTLGLASAIATNGISFESLKPEQWDKFSIVGNLVYQESNFISAPLRGATLTFSEGKISRTIVTGAQGEFSESFSKLVSYSRLRLFPFPIFEIRDKSVPVVKVPLTIKLKSKICNAQTTIDEIPLEPLIFIASTSDKAGTNE